MHLLRNGVNAREAGAPHLARLVVEELGEPAVDVGRRPGGSRAAGVRVSWNQDLRQLIDERELRRA